MVKIDVAASEEIKALDDKMLIWIINTVLAFVMLNETNQQSDPQDTIGINRLKESANLTSQFSQGLKGHSSHNSMSQYRVSV